MTCALEESGRAFDLIVEQRSEAGTKEKLQIRGPMKKLQKKVILQSLCHLIGIAFDASLEAAVADCAKQLQALFYESLRLEPEDLSRKLADADIKRSV